MGIFGLGKKKEQSKISQANLPKDMPEFPSTDDMSDFPRYEPTVADIKREIGDGMNDDLDVPMRQKNFGTSRMAGATIKTVPEEEFLEEVPVENVIRSSSRNLPQDGKPLFVRLDNYKEVMNTINVLKEKLSNAEMLLKALEDVRQDEDKKLQTWKRDLSTVKEKLMSVDKSLFEV